MPGTLYLVPTTLDTTGATPLAAQLPADVIERIRRLDVFVVEAPKTARAFLKRVGMPRPLSSLEFYVLSEHTRETDLPAMLAPLLSGRDVGLMSEAGCPAVADPGRALVRLAHRHGIPVVPLVGPSAILLALMGAGLTGQRFRFHGYLPAEPRARVAALKRLERDSQRARETQIFIETPYRTPAMLAACLSSLAEDSWLCVAASLLSPHQRIHSASVADWRQSGFVLAREAAVFLLEAASGPSLGSGRRR